MAQHRILARYMRIGAAVVLTAGVFVASVQITSAFSDPERSRLDALVGASGPAFGYLAMAIGIAGVLAGVASLVDRQADRDEQPVMAALQQLGQLVGRVGAETQKLQGAVQELSARKEAAAPPAEGRAAAYDDAMFRRLREKLDEVSLILLMNEDQRRARLAQLLQERKRESLAEARTFLRNQEWGKAQQVLSALEQQFPDDAEVRQLRQEADQAMAQEGQKAFDAAASKIEDLMALSNWEQAMAQAKRLAEDFPASDEARVLLERVRREHTLFREQTVQRLYEQVKGQIERRQWRKALETARQLVERFPDSRRAVGIRQQLDTIQVNAEIEERQEREDRIQELVKSKRYAEAILMSEQLIREYPSSPQAEQLEEMLPKLRQLARERFKAV